MTTVIVAAVTLVLSAILTWIVSSAYQKKVTEGKIGSAEERARKIIDEALKTAEETKREKLLEVKEEALKTRNELEKEVRDRRNEVQRTERRIQQKEETINHLPFNQWR